MAVEIQVLANDGPGGREKGAIIDIEECPEGEKVRWGSADGPPFFRIIRIDKVMKKDLPPEMLDFGWNCSRVKLDDTKLSAESNADLLAGKPVAVDSADLKAITLDKGEKWRASMIAEIGKDAEVIKIGK